MIRWNLAVDRFEFRSNSEIHVSRKTQRKMVKFYIVGKINRLCGFQIVKQRNHSSKKNNLKTKRKVFTNIPSLTGSINRLIRFFSKFAATAEHLRVDEKKHSGFERSSNQEIEFETMKKVGTTSKATAFVIMQHLEIYRFARHNKIIAHIKTFQDGIEPLWNCKAADLVESWIRSSWCTHFKN